MDYYHLVTRKSMYLGQIIDFSNGEHNRLYEFWMTREERNAEGKDAFDILTEKDINADNLDVISGYVFNQSRAVRETIAELVRVKEFPNLPSRFSCLYVSKTLEDALKWKENFESFDRKVLQLIRLRTDRPSFTSDAALLPKVNGESFDKKIVQARRYWSGELTGEMEETLIDGRIEVVEIIEEY